MPRHLVDILHLLRAPGLSSERHREEQSEEDRQVPHYREDGHLEHLDQVSQGVVDAAVCSRSISLTHIVTTSLRQLRRERPASVPLLALLKRRDRPQASHAHLQHPCVYR